MEINFDQIPSVTELQRDPAKENAVAGELQVARQLLSTREVQCEPIKPVYKRPQAVKPYKLAYKFICVCPRYRPHYCCKHVGNIIVDRDMLTQEEHICFLSTPKANFGAKRFMPRFYHRRVIVSDCTARIEQLACPDIRRVRETIENYQHILKKRQFRSLQKYLKPKSDIHHAKLQIALAYMEEEKRLQGVQKSLKMRRLRRIRRRITFKQRHQIRKIICFLFDEMKDLLLNDQYLIDETSTLCAVILEQIRDFTEKDFFSTNNLRQYQQVLANNITVWINKFISNLDIEIKPTHKRQERPEPETFLPVSDYIPLSDHEIDEGMGPIEDTPFPEDGECDYTSAFRADAIEDLFNNINN